MKILFISRAYPPTIGGIEKQNFGIAQALSKIAHVKVIANKRGKKYLPVFLLTTLVRLLFIFGKYDIVLFGDGVLAPLAVIAKVFSRHAKFVSIIHGLDITYAQRTSFMGSIYRKINIPALKKFDLLIMVGNQTITEAIAVGIEREKCTFIPNGFENSDVCEQHSRSELEKLLGTSLANKKVLLRVGRYVPHKGVPWFIENVVPHLPQEYIFVAAGATASFSSAGDQNVFTVAQSIVKKHNLKNRVWLLTNISWQNMKILYNTADLVVSPNIPIKGSLEGFGINTIEAAGCGRIVLASDLEGLKDSIKDGVSGFLVPPKDALAWRTKIMEVLSDQFDRVQFGEKAQYYTTQNFQWDKIAKKYLHAIEKVWKEPRAS